MARSRRWRWFAALAFVLLLAGITAAHVVILARVERGANRVAAHPPWVVGTKARQLHDALFVADLHADTLLGQRDILQRARRGHVDLPRLQQGNVGLQVFSATTKSPAGQNYTRNTADSDRVTLLALLQWWRPRTWTSLYQRALYQLEKLERFADGSHGALMVVRSRDDLRQLVALREAGRQVTGAIYLIEGAHPLEGDVHNLDLLFARGLRVVGLTHFFDNALGGSLHGVSQDGLTDFGRAVVRRANELGVVIDVAHASPQMVRDVLALSTRPVIFSHGGTKRACDTNRNLADELMTAIADGGGLVGIGYWSGAVCDISPRGVVAAIRAAIDLVGISHVALGSDYDGNTTVMFDAGELAVLTQAMLDAGFTESEIRAVMGGNTLRFFLASLPGPD